MIQRTVVTASPLCGVVHFYNICTIFLLSRSCFLRVHVRPSSEIRDFSQCPDLCSSRFSLLRFLSKKCIALNPYSILNDFNRSVFLFFGLPHTKHSSCLIVNLLFWFFLRFSQFISILSNAFCFVYALD